MNRSVLLARIRIVPLCAALFTRSLGQAAVRTYIFVLLLRSGSLQDGLALIFLWLCLGALPAFAMAPLIGALAGSPYRRATMIGATLIAVAVIGVFALQGNQALWPVVLGVFAIEGAFFAACRQTLAPVAAREARVSLPRLLALILLAVAGGELTGLAVVLQAYNPLAKVDGASGAVVTGI